MHVLFLARKNLNDIGGLGRFTANLLAYYPHPYTFVSLKTPWQFSTIAQRSIDLIHLTDASLLAVGCLLKRLLGKPMTVTAHGLDVTFANSLYQKMLRTLLPSADAIILDSKPAKTTLDTLPIPAQQQYIISPGISIKQFSQTQPLHLPNMANAITLLTVGNLVPRKGHCWFIEHVITRLPNHFIYYIVGDGAVKNQLVELVNKFHLRRRVFLLGKLSDSQLGYVFKQSSIYVCPNRHIQGNFEGFGIAAGEAAALGLPVVASSVDGLSAVIQQGKNGWLVMPRRAAFLGALKTLEDPQERRRLGSCARDYMQSHFLWKNTIKAYRQVFKEVSGKS